jgi:hypothetical protein
MAVARILVIAFVFALVPACDDDEDIIIVDDPVGDTVDEGFARGDQIAGDASAELSDDDFSTVIGKTATILAVVNDGFIQQSDFAAQVVLAGDIFDYANTEIIDHQDSNTALDGVVRFYGVPFLASSTADILVGEFTSGLSLLRATPPVDVDFEYINLMVLEHAEALVLLDELFVQVGPGEMGDFILDMSAMLDAHLLASEDLLATFF